MKKGAVIRNTNLIHAELCYKIVGCAYEVFNSIGSGHKENVYQRGLHESFIQAGLISEQQFPVSIKFNNKVIGRSYIDFFINKEVIVEIKRDRYFSRGDIEQVMNYLKSKGLKLGILINFNHDGVLYKRMVNL